MHVRRRVQSFSASSTVTQSAVRVCRARFPSSLSVNKLRGRKVEAVGAACMQVAEVLSNREFSCRFELRLSQAVEEGHFEFQN
jgi:hypothetical protein